MELSIQQIAIELIKASKVLEQISAEGADDHVFFAKEAVSIYTATIKELKTAQEDEVLGFTNSVN